MYTYRGWTRFFYQRHLPYQNGWEPVKLKNAIEESTFFLRVENKRKKGGSREPTHIWEEQEHSSILRDPPVLFFTWHSTVRRWIYFANSSAFRRALVH